MSSPDLPKTGVPEKSVRKRLTYANVMSSIAVFLVVAGGTAFAASQLGKESVGTRQLKKEAVSLAKINAAAKSSLKGATGPAGATGPQGPKGDRGERGEPGPAVLVLPSGQTETGVWGASAENENWAIADLKFAPTLPGEVDFAHEKFLAVGETSPECPAVRHAAPGYLCVYSQWNYHLVFNGFFNAFTETSTADKTGVVIYLKSNLQAGNARGNWAYTAP